MGRLRFSGDLVFSTGVAGTSLVSAAGTTTVVYADAAAVTPADITLLDGTPVAGSVLTDSSSSFYPDFLGPTGDVAVLYVVVNGGPPARIEAAASAQVAVETTRATTAEATKLVAGSTATYANLAALPAASAHTNEIHKTLDGGVYESTGSAWVQLVAPTGTYAPRHAMGPSGFWLPGGNPFTTTPVIGIDPVNDLMWFVGSTSIKQVTSLGTVISTDKTQPAGIVSQTAKKMLTFKGNHYLAAADLTGAGSTALAGIWQAPPAAGSTAFTWTKVASASAGSQGHIGPAFNKIVDANGNDLALLWAEYSDPTNGPSMWRSTDGTTWTRVIQITDASMRHFHCVIQDPYNPAVIYATGGDGVAKPIWRSTDFGATWAVIITDSNWQAVQVTFSANWIWFAGDSSRDSVFVMDRATLTPRMAATNHHRYIAVPHPLPRPGGHVFADGVTGSGSKTFTSATAAFTAADIGRLVMCQNVPVDTIISAVGSGTSITMSQAATAAGSALPFTLGGDEFYRSGFYGIVDPATEIFYFTANDSTSGGNTSGLFMLPYVGGRIELVESFYAITNVANGQVSAEHFIYNNKLWMAGKNHLLAAFIAAA